MSPRPSYDVYSNYYFNWHGKEEIKIWCHTFLLNWIEQSVQLIWEINSTDIIFLASNISFITTVYQFEYFNWCEIFVIASFHCATWVIIQALFVRRFYHCMYEQFPPHFTLVINNLKHQFDQSLSTTLLLILLRIQPIHLDWSLSLLGSFTVSCVVMSPK